MRGFYLVYILMLFCLIAKAQKTPDYRKIRWGMTKGEVIGLERSGYSYDNETMAVNDIVINGQTAQLVYKFDQNKLVAAIVIFNNKYINNSQYISDYKSINTGLTTKYGKPTTSKIIYIEPEKNLFLSEPGDNLFLGKTRYLTKWTSARTIIKHGLKSPNASISHYIEYIYKAYDDQRRSTKYDNL